MTKIKFYKSNSKFIGVECSGHSGYAESGSDIVCSAISVLVGSLHLGLKKVLKIKNIVFKQDENKGYFYLKITENQLEKSQILFETVFETLKEIQSDYPKFVEIKQEELNEIY